MTISANSSFIILRACGSVLLLLVVIFSFSSCDSKHEEPREAPLTIEFESIERIQLLDVYRVWDGGSILLELECFPDRSRKLMVKLLSALASGRKETDLVEIWIWLQSASDKSRDPVPDPDPASAELLQWMTGHVANAIVGSTGDENREDLADLTDLQEVLKGAERLTWNDVSKMFPHRPERSARKMRIIIDAARP